MLDHRLLQAFVTVAQTGSVSRAAATLGYSQPAVSMQVQRMERALGARLFSRDTGRLQLTATGRECFALAEVILLLGQRLSEPVPGIVRTVGAHSSQASSAAPSPRRHGPTQADCGG